MESFEDVSIVQIVQQFLELEDGFARQYFELKGSSVEIPFENASFMDSRKSKAPDDSTYPTISNTLFLGDFLLS